MEDIKNEIELYFDNHISLKIDGIIPHLYLMNNGTIEYERKNTLVILDKSNILYIEKNDEIKEIGKIISYTIYYKIDDIYYSSVEFNFYPNTNDIKDMDLKFEAWLLKYEYKLYEKNFSKPDNMIYKSYASNNQNIYFLYALAFIIPLTILLLVYFLLNK